MRAFGMRRATTTLPKLGVVDEPSRRSEISEEDLWNEIWAIVEAPGSPQSASKADERPLKNCAASAARGAGASSSSAIAALSDAGKIMRFSSGRAFYDVLGVCNTASNADIRTAYRRRALAAHPDKGGSAEQFRMIAEAFEVLCDEGSRREYDEELARSGHSDGAKRRRCNTKTAQDSSTVSMTVRAQRGVARAEYEKMLMEREASWASKLGALAQESLEFVQTLIQAKEHQPHMERSPCTHDTAAARAAKSVRRGAYGYCVEIMWSGMQIQSGWTSTLDEALDWHLALTRARDASKAVRQAQVAKAQAAGKPPKPPSTLTELELVHLYKTEPSMQLAFRFVVPHEGQKFWAPLTRDLRLALLFRGRLLKAMKSRGNNATIARRLEEAKAQLQKEAQVERKRREERAAKLVDAVAQELKRREKSKRGCKRKVTTSELLALPAPTRRIRSKEAPLAIVDTTIAEKTRRIRSKEAPLAIVDTTIAEKPLASQLPGSKAVDPCGVAARSTLLPLARKVQRTLKM